MMNGYLIRVRERVQTLALKRQIVLGLVGGWLLLVIGSFRLFYVVNARTITCQILLVAGAVLFLLGLLRPQALGRFETGIRISTGFIGKTIFAIVLSFVYVVLVTPVGLVWRAVRGRRPFYAWAGDTPPAVEGWVVKQAVDDDRSVSQDAVRRSLITQPFVIVGYFIRHGHFILIPVVLFLLSIGLILFFVKSSALAPFIYTLF
jgi:hypothetical protein